MLRHNETVRRVSRDKAFEQIVNLILNQDRVAHNWVARYITIQAGLAAAEFALMSVARSSSTQAEDAIARVALIIVPLLGIVFAYVAMKIIQREFRWSRLYMVTARHVESGDRRIIFNFVRDFARSAAEDEKKEVNQRGRIEGLLLLVTYVVVVSWIAILVSNLLSR